MATASEKKDTLMRDLVSVRQGILDAAAGLPAGKQGEVFLGIWSVRELLAHMIGWDYTNTRAAHAVQEGQVPDFYSRRDRGWASYNASLVQEYMLDEFASLLDAARISHRLLLEIIESIPARNLVRDYGVRVRGYRVTIFRLLESELKDEKEHLEQIRHFAG